MTRQGRTLEQIVALIEQALGIKAEVRTPEYFSDLHTGQQREVDVTIRVRNGAREHLTLIECRAHAEAQDVTWIEQLLGKRLGISANRVIAVSSSGFTSPAIEKARAFGIELRSFQDIDLETVKGWAEPYTIHLQYRNWRVQNAELHLNAAQIEALGVKGDRREVESPFEMKFRSIATDETVSLVDIWREIARIHPDMKNLPEDGSRVRLRPFVGWKEPQYEFIFPEGQIILRSFYIDVTCWSSEKVEELVPQGGYFTVTRESRDALAALLECSVRIDGRSVKVVAVVPPGGSGTKVGFFPEPE